MTDGDQAAGGKEKIAILGGGIAGLTTAFELTKADPKGEKFDITIYQMGWRLGGKCATGRGVFGRIEEHGIHAFIGSYFNALNMMSECYEAYESLIKSGAVKNAATETFAGAFKGADSVLLWEWFLEGADSRLVRWAFPLASNGLKIQTRADCERSIALVKEIIENFGRLGSLYYDDRVKPASSGAGKRTPIYMRSGLPYIWSAIGFIWSLLSWYISRRAQVDGFLSPLKRQGVGAAFLKTVSSWFWADLFASSLSHKIERIRTNTNYVFALWRGVFTPDYNIFKSGFEILDDRNFLEWLIFYGLDKTSQGSPMVVNAIDLSYNYPDGDNSRPPLMAAGTYVRWTLRSFLNLESFVWTFQVGTGETVIMPLYEVLKSRGVKFEFFHKVTSLNISEVGDRIESVRFDVQADVIADPMNKSAEYDPLVRIDIGGASGSRQINCWPSEPNYDKLIQGVVLKQQNIDLESYWTTWRGRENMIVAGKDYDNLVFAISIGAAPYLLPELKILSSPSADDPPQAAAWRAMVEGAPACATQTLQVWFDKTSDEMGVQPPPGLSNAAYRTISGTFVAPFNGQADLTDLIGFEGWEHADVKTADVATPKSLWYFSGALTLRFPKPSDSDPLAGSANVPTPQDFLAQAAGLRALAQPFTNPAFPASQKQRVGDFAVQFLQATAGYLLPKASAAWEPAGLDFATLHPIVPPTPQATTTFAGLATPLNAGIAHQLAAPSGTNRVHNQFWKANIDPTERYVQCPPGGTKMRLRADQSGFDNLFLAGDWTRNGLNVGSVEGAVMGGKLAAIAVCKGVTGLARPPLPSDVIG